jgi:putative ABC transport system ATP-binding protein
MTEHVVVIEGLAKTYGSGSAAVHALKGVSFSASAGELLAIRGRSGSGKTTLLNLIGGLDRATSGRVIVDGRDVTALSESELLELRRGHVSYVFQSFGLIPVLSAAENVGVPLRLQGCDARSREERVATMLERVGLSAHVHQRPDELSGGQQQRVALARALVSRPRLLLADEPTGQLDSQTGHAVMELIRELVVKDGVTAIVTTHDPTLIKLADRVLELRDGEIHEVIAATANAGG